jgi:glycosyltransferase involved in cell wall biosynthesis
VTAVHVVLADGVDDPGRPSGGNVYDRRICDGLAAAGWDVREIVARGRWPGPDAGALRDLGSTLAAVPDGSLVLLDGLVASAAASVLVPEGRRLRLVVLVHMPFGGVEVPAEDEAAVLLGARAVVTTSRWTRGLLLGRHPLDPATVHVVPPGADPADPVPVSPDGGRLLCVAALAPHKGQDVLVDALSGLADLPWRCTLVGPLDSDPAHVQRVRRRVAEHGLGGRISLSGPRAGDGLRRAYANADLLVLPSRREAFGMVVAEALAVGLPVVASAVGGVPEALGTTATGVPGILVPPDDAPALRAALSDWLGDDDLRRRLRRAALLRRTALTDWDTTTGCLASVLRTVDAEPAPAGLRVPR